MTNTLTMIEAIQTTMALMGASYEEIVQLGALLRRLGEDIDVDARDKEDLTVLANTLSNLEGAYDDTPTGIAIEKQLKVQMFKAIYQLGVLRGQG